MYKKLFNLNSNDKEAIMIKNDKTLKNALARISSVTALNVLTEAMTFGIGQLQDHNNASPLSIILVRVKGLAKRPRGFTQKSLLEYCESFGLEWNKKRCSFSIGKNASDFGEMNPTFWTDLPVPVKAAPKTTAEKLVALLKDVEMDDALKMLGIHYNAEFTIVADDDDVEAEISQAA